MKTPMLYIALLPLFAAVVTAKIGDPANTATPLTVTQVNDFLNGVWDAIALGHDFDDFSSCITGQVQAGVQLQKAMDKLSSSSAVDVSHGLSTLGKVVSIAADGIKACKMRDQYFATINQIIGNFTNPVNLTVVPGTNLTIDGIDVFNDASSALTAYKNLDMATCGQSIGTAMGKVYYGQQNTTGNSMVTQINAIPNLLWTAAVSPQFNNTNLWSFKKHRVNLKRKSHTTDNSATATSDAATEEPVTVSLDAVTSGSVSASSRKNTTNTTTTNTTTTNTTTTGSSFDSRTTWPNCVHPIRDQGNCGDCWAVAASEVLSDRFCIASNKSINTVLSPQYLVSCDTADMACNGGYLNSAWKFLENSGEVTETCWPYASGNGAVPTCSSFSKCKDSSTLRKYYAKVNSTKTLTSASAIQTEIAANGPVEAGMDVYSDFMYYSSGIYSSVSGSYLGGHAVKIIGWGASSGVNYWIVANSWGTSWGESGFFRIQFGNSNIDSQAYAGLPDLSRQ